MPMKRLKVSFVLKCYKKVKSYKNCFFVFSNRKKKKVCTKYLANTLILLKMWCCVLMDPRNVFFFLHLMSYTTMQNILLGREKNKVDHFLHHNVSFWRVSCINMSLTYHQIIIMPNLPLN